LEAVVERLHEVLDSRNAAAVFNASAMAAGGGRSTSTTSALSENWLSAGFQDIPGDSGLPILQLGSGGADGSRAQQLRINTSVGNVGTGAGGRKAEDEESMSASSGAASDASESDLSGGMSASESGARNSNEGKAVWKGDVSAVIGLQKRGLRGLMEGRRLRERGASIGPTQQNPVPRVGLGIGGASGAI
jgi:hypothetical protein